MTYPQLLLTLTCRPRLLRRDDACAFLHDIETVRGKVMQHLGTAGRPSTLYVVDLIRGAQSKVLPQIVLREVAATTAHFIHSRNRTGNHANLRSESEPVPARADQLQ